MSDVDDFLIQAMRQRQEDDLNPDGSQKVLTWNGADYPACVGAYKDMKSLGIGGWAKDADLIGVIILADLVPDFETPADLVGAVPAVKQTVTHNGKDYRINDTNTKFAAFISLALNDKSRGA